MRVLRLFLSPGHNFFGHHGTEPGQHPIIEVDQVECVKGRGILTDRFFDHKKEYKGQITFFADEVYQELQERFQTWDRSPGVFRRNVITAGADLSALVGVEFEIQGIRFFGAEECKPCYWMDLAFGPGAEAAMQGRGGLRARILSDGTLRREGTTSNG